MLYADVGAAVLLTGLDQAQLLRAQHLRQKRLPRLRQQLHEPVLHRGQKLRKRLRLHALVRETPAQDRHAILRRDRVQVIVRQSAHLLRLQRLLGRVAQQRTARAHRRQQRIRACGRKNERRAARRLLQQLQKRILRIEIHQLCLTQNVDLLFRLARQDVCRGRNTADLIDLDHRDLAAAIRLDIDHVRVHMVIDLAAVPARAARAHAVAAAEHGRRQIERQPLARLFRLRHDDIRMQQMLLRLKLQHTRAPFQHTLFILPAAAGFVNHICG